MVVNKLLESVSPPPFLIVHDNRQTNSNKAFFILHTDEFSGVCYIDVINCNYSSLACQILDPV